MNCDVDGCEKIATHSYTLFNDEHDIEEDFVCCAEHNIDDIEVLAIDWTVFHKWWK